MSGGFWIEDPGLFSTVQDIGRLAYQRFGVPVSGALDADAHSLANALVGNPPGAAAVEMRYLGPTFTVEAQTARIAMVGAGCGGEIRRGEEQLPLPVDQSVTLEQGDCVRVGPLSGSVTATLAVAGGIEVPSVLNSRATFTRSAFGGLEGRAMAAGDLLPLAADTAPEGPDRALPRAFDLASPDRIRVVLGPQDDHFTEEAVSTFLTAQWTITQNADRMGLRLDGPPLQHRDGFNITSDGIVTGAIQVPGNGLPILLLADRQTSGGYPKIATVITADLPTLGRMGPGQILRFQPVSATEGAHLARAHRDWLAKTMAGLRPVPADGLDLDALYRENLITPPILPE